MTDSAITTLIQAVASSIAAVASCVAVVASKRNGEKTDVAIQKTDVAIAQNVDLQNKTTEIGAKVDGTASDMAKQLAVANERISGLEKMLASTIVGKA